MPSHYTRRGCVWSRISHAFRRREFTPSHPDSQLTATGFLNPGRQAESKMAAPSLQASCSDVPQMFLSLYFCAAMVLVSASSHSWDHQNSQKKTRILTRRLSLLNGYIFLRFSQSCCGIFGCSTSSGHFKIKKTKRCIAFMRVQYPDPLFYPLIVFSLLVTISSRTTSSRLATKSDQLPCGTTASPIQAKSQLC